MVLNLDLVLVFLLVVSSFASILVDEGTSFSPAPCSAGRGDGRVDVVVKRMDVAVGRMDNPANTI